jgi:ribosomal protein S18 acetylase RimI-like enzyme
MAAPAGIEIKRLLPVDAHVLAQVAEDVFDEPINPERARDYLAQAHNCLIVALDGTLVVGQARAMVHLHPDKPPELYIDNLGVAPAYRRRGIGRVMVEKLLAWGRDEGCTEAWVGTETDNGPAHALYMALGSAPAEPFNLYFYTL